MLPHMVDFLVVGDGILPVPVSKIRATQNIQTRPLGIQIGVFRLVDERYRFRL